jgi:hypothetical protein
MLFFGVWEILTKNNVSSRHFIFETAGGPALRTMRVRALLHSIRQSIKGEGDRSLGIRLGYLNEIYAAINAWRSSLVTVEDPDLLSSTRIIERQSALMLETLQMLYGCWPSGFIKQRPRIVHNFGRQRSFYEQRLLTNGWCPSNYDLLDYFGRSVLEYACASTHHPDISRPKHGHCDAHVCRANNVTAATFQALHLKLGCCCDYVKIPRSKIRDIVQSGNFFVLDITLLLAPDASPGHAMVPYEPGLEYIAFSHVWSHGLGSPADVGLPTCRLECIRDLLLSSQNPKTEHRRGEKLFWIDSLSIPMDHELKMKSIGMMEKIYQKASAVLVLDSSLQNISPAEVSLEMIALQILTSDWNRRLWTFQEAMLAKDLRIALKNEWMSLQTLCNNLNQRLLQGDISPMTFRCWQRLYVLASARQKNSGLFEWFQLLQFRACSVPSDEAIVISTLSQLETSSLNELDAEHRMARLWTMLRRVPAGLLFHASVRLQVPNYRWAPKSLMRGAIETGLRRHMLKDAEVTTEGLFARYFIIEFPQRRFQTTKHLETVDFEITLYLPGMRLQCSLRAFDNCDDSKELPFDALVFIRNPADHHMDFGNTKLSAVALLKIETNNLGITRYRFQYQMLVKISDSLGEPQVGSAEARNIIIA